MSVVTLDLTSQIQLDIFDIMEKIEFVVQDMDYLLSDPERKFLATSKGGKVKENGERDFVENNYKLFKDIQARLKRKVIIY